VSHVDKPDSHRSPDVVSSATQVANAIRTTISLPFHTSTSPATYNCKATPANSTKSPHLLLPIMDEDFQDLLALGVFMVALLSMPFVLLMSIMTCVAYSRTKAWDKARNQGAIALESERLVDDDESDFLDTDDEDDHKKRKADEEADKTLTFKQKFWKEFKHAWTGKSREDIVKTKEREERRKLAKAVAREMDRRERRRARQAEDLPPSYKN